MTVTVEDLTPQEFNCTGVTTFPITNFSWNDDSDLVVTYITTAGGETVLTYNVDYTVSGGTITWPAVPSSGTLFVSRSTAKTQGVNLVNGNDFDANNINEEFDKLTFIVQEIGESVALAPKFKPTSGRYGIEIEEPVAEKWLKMNSAGDGVVMADAPVSSGSLVVSDFGTDLVSKTAKIYIIDPSCSDQGAATAEANRSIKDIVDALGSSHAELWLLHSGIGDTTSYAIDTDETTPENVKIVIFNGARLTQVTGDEKLTVHSPEHLLVGKRQVITAADALAFTVPGIVTPYWWNAKGDSSTDDLLAFTYASNALNDAGGGSIFVPALDGDNYYKLSAPLYLRNYMRLFGEGRSSWLHNSATTGFSKCVIIAGNGDSAADAGSIYNETFYDIVTMSSGTKVVTFATAADSNNFSVGDVVFIKSFDTFTVSGDPKFVNTNIVEAVSAGTVTLKYRILDNLVSSPPNYAGIARLTGDLDGIDGEPHYAPIGCCVENLRLSNVISATDGYYGLHLGCLESSFRNIWMDTIAKGIGTAGASYNSFKNIWISCYAAGVDLAYFSCGNRLRNVDVSKTTGTTAIGDIGISMHEPGGDNHINGFSVDVMAAADTIGVSMWENHHSSVKNGVVTNAGTTGILAGPEGIGNRIESNEIIRSGDQGIFIPVGSIGTIVIGNTIKESTNYGIEIGTGSDEYLVSNNVIGVNGSRTAADVIYDAARGANGWINGNVTFSSRRRVVNTTSYNSSGAGASTLYTKQIDEGTLRYGQGIRITIAGQRSGVNDTKNIQLLFGAQVINQVDWGAAETGHFRIEATLIAEGTTHIRATSVGDMGVEIEDQNYVRFANPSESADADLTVVANVTDAGDSVYLYMIDIEPINDQVYT
jgi:hypothetical protein